jgi:stearoyl-CoA desaturase (delta-9 desaturase)
LRPLIERVAIAKAIFLAHFALIPGIPLLALGRVSALDLILVGVMYVATMFGFTVGYHRMVAHRAFEPHPALKAVLLALGGMSVMGTPSGFAAYHLAHHADPDGPQDPHSPRHGFFHAHLGWFASRYKQDLTRFKALYQDDRMIVFFDKTFLLWSWMGAIIPFFVGGLFGGTGSWSWAAAGTATLWGGFFRLSLGSHAIWAGASVGHRYGSRDFATADGSRNSWLVNLVQLGDGWHNNHHALPGVANCSTRVGQIDVPGLVIAALEACGLARNVRWASRSDWDRRRAVLAARADS